VKKWLLAINSPAKWTAHCIRREQQPRETALQCGFRSIMLVYDSSMGMMKEWEH